MIALGGAIGAMLVGILAPVIFSGVYELGFAHCALAALWLYQMRGFSRGVLIAGACVLPFTGVAAIFKIKVFTDKTVLVTRNFYGVLRVQENDNGDMDYFQRTLTDGTTVHGEQFPKGKNERVPTTYYTANSGIGRTLRAIGLKTACIVENSMENRLYPSGWVLLTRSAGFLDVDNIRKATIRIPARPEWRMWTDDFSNLFQVLK